MNPVLDRRTVASSDRWKEHDHVQYNNVNYVQPKEQQHRRQPRVQQPHEKNLDRKNCTSGTTPDDVCMFPHVLMMMNVHHDRLNDVTAVENNNNNSNAPPPSSKSIPISNMHRTPSEVQLQEDEAMAEYRDLCMYSRIVNGIQEGQQRRRRQHHRPPHHRLQPQHWNDGDDNALANIVRTRHSPLVVADTSPSSSALQEDFLFSRRWSDTAATTSSTAAKTSSNQQHQTWTMPKTEETNVFLYGLAPRLEQPFYQQQQGSVQQVPDCYLSQPVKEPEPQGDDDDDEGIFVLDI